MSHESSVIKTEPKKVLKNASFMSLGTLVSRFLGLLRDILLGALFDRIVTDAWTAAFRIPNLFRRLFGEGALSVSFVPEFIEAQSQDSSGLAAKNFANAVYTVLLIFLAIITLLGFVFIEPLFKILLSPEYMLNEARWDLTVRLGRIMFGFVFFICQYAYFMGLLNALGSFALPAAAPALLNISMLIFTVVPTDLFFQPADGLAWGVFVGGIAQAAVLMGALYYKGYLPKIEKNFWNRKVLRVFSKTIPSVFGVGVLQIVTLINLYFASQLGEGTLSYIYWADRLLEFPLSLVSVSIGTALLPTLSLAVTRVDRSSFRENAAESILMNLFFAIPCAVGLYFLAEPIIEALFYRGKFSEQDLVHTASVLRIYGLALVVISLNRVLVPLFYAHKDTFTPMIGAILGLFVHIIVAPYWMQSLGLEGLIRSVVLMSLVNFVWLLLMLPLKTFGLNWSRVISSTFKIIIASAIMFIATQGYGFVAGEVGRRGNTLILFLVILISVFVYFSANLVFKSAEAEKIKRLLYR